MSARRDSLDPLSLPSWWVELRMGQTIRVWLPTIIWYYATYGSTGLSGRTANGSPAPRSGPNLYGWVANTFGQTVGQARSGPCSGGHLSGAGACRTRETGGGDTRSPVRTRRSSSLNPNREFDDTGYDGNGPPSSSLDCAARQSDQSASERK